MLFLTFIMIFEKFELYPLLMVMHHYKNSQKRNEAEHHPDFFSRAYLYIQEGTQKI